MDILIVIEHKNGKVHRMSWEAVVAGQSLAKELGLSTAAVVLGHRMADLVQEISHKNVGEVLVAEDRLLSTYSGDGYSRALSQVIESESPTYVVAGHTYMVRDFFPKVSAALGKPFLPDNIAYHVENGSPIFTKQVFMGKLAADVVPSKEGPYLISFQSAAFQADAVEPGTGVSTRNVAVKLDDSMIKTRSEEPFQETTSEVDLASADVIVAVGRGIGKNENIRLAEELAKAMGAQLAASRPVIDSGWLPPYHQVGSSGETVAPKLYLALGISGAIQHIVGMKGSKSIVVINKDPEAPIFELADYGIVGDILEIVPRLTEAIRAAKGADS